MGEEEHGEIMMKINCLLEDFWIEITMLRVGLKYCYCYYFIMFLL